MTAFWQPQHSREKEIEREKEKENKTKQILTINWTRGRDSAGLRWSHRKTRPAGRLARQLLRQEMLLCCRTFYMGCVPATPETIQVRSFNGG